jgi:hypothetical protein
MTKNKSPRSTSIPSSLSEDSGVPKTETGAFLFRGTLKFWAMVAWLLKDELGKNTNDDKKKS